MIDAQKPRNFQRREVILGEMAKVALGCFCYHSNELYNSALSSARYIWIDSNRYATSSELVTEMQSIGNRHFQALDPDVAAHTCLSASQSVALFSELMQDFLDSNSCECPRFPSGRGLQESVCVYPASRMKLMGDLIEMHLGDQALAKSGLGAFHLPMHPDVDFKAMDELRILSRNGRFYVEYSHFEDSAS